MMDADRNFAFKIAVKLLQIETLAILTAYKKLVTALSNSTITKPYDVRFSFVAIHALQTTDNPGLVN